MARWYIEKIYPFHRKAVQMARPVMRRMTDMPLPEDDIFDSIEELVVFLERMSQLLSDGNISSVRVVLNPEKMVVKEAQRAYTYLNLYGYTVDAVVCNRVFPRDLSDSYFDIWKSAQAQNLQLVHECFQPLPIFEVPLFDQEVTGIAMLRRMSSTVFGPATTQGGEGDPTRHFYAGKSQEILRRNGQYVLSLPLPLVERSDVQLHRSVYDELVVRIGNWKRNIALPLGLARLDIVSAKYEGDRLNITFQPDKAVEIPAEELKPRGWEALKARFQRK
jgi:arsenite-transporting ATPase